MSRETSRTVIGFISAPLVGVVAWGVLIAGTGPAPIEALLPLPAFVIFSSIYAYPAVLVSFGERSALHNKRLQLTKPEPPET